MNPRLPAKEIFELRSPRNPQLSGRKVRDSIKVLQRVAPDIDGASSAGLEDRVDELKQRLQTSGQNGWDWYEATNVPRREWTLLRLYTLHLGIEGAEDWLCEFDDAVAESVLGMDSRRWHPSRRRAATMLFFVQFDLIACLPRFAEMLRVAWQSADGNSHNPDARTWTLHAEDLFALDGPDRIAAHWRQGETINSLSNRFFVPQTSLFRDRLFDAVLLRRLRQIPLFDEERELFGEIERSKTRAFRDGRLLGSRAVEIMLGRVIAEADGRWEEAWSRHLVPLACHPRTLDPGEKERWWGWANPRQMEIVLRGLTGLNIREFIRLLEGSLRGTGNEHQFPKRRDFLLKMFDGNVIEEAKLVVNTNFYDQLDTATKRSLQPSRNHGGGQNTSFICLQCAGGVFLIEGTHSFALRAFRGRHRFPIPLFWSSPPELYDGALFRADQSICDIYQRHTSGWEDSFLYKLRRDLHIEWPRI